MKLAGTCVYVDDLPAALDFYRRAFGLGTRLLDESNGYAELDTGGDPGMPPILAFATHQMGETLMPAAYARAPGGLAGVEVAFYVTDVQAAFARVVAAGAAPLSEPRVMPWGQTVAYLRAPEGTILGLCTPMGEAVTLFPQAAQPDK